ncbi:transketolase-like [Antedon mediterranea]|uniref:transketolase-like n=1 Tax=Antedon mediterranea TaxID=105859 RepID=UPI003AF6D178
MSKYHKPDNEKIQALKDIGNKLRILSIKATSAAGSGHPTSCCSMADIMSVLFFHVMKYKVNDQRDCNSDRFVLSKGHAAPILYACWVENGGYPEQKLMELRKIDNTFEGHPTPRLDFVDVATGSLGQGLSNACGMAYTGKYFDKASYRVFCLIGDGESAEGSIWEACAFASEYKLDNLVLILDANRLGQSQPTALGHQMDTYQKRFDAFGWNAIVVDGHNVEDLCKVFHEASVTTGKPTAILAKTFKGKGCPDVENLENWHGKALGAKAEGAIDAISKLIKNNKHSLTPPVPVDDAPAVNISEVKLFEAPSYSLGDMVATRVAYGTALVKIGKDNKHVVAIDGDMKNSTYSIKFRDAFPDRFIECFIAEQNLVGVAMGAACRNRTVAFASTFACFLSRAYDQIRMGAVSQSNVNFMGSHVGISIGEDGPSQMALEDLSMFRAIPGCTVFYPSDAVAMERAVELAANTPGMCFIRASRPTTPVVYGNTEEFKIGKAKVRRQSDKDQVTIVAAGVTLPEAEKAAVTLAAEGINVCVVDPFTVKPIDKATLLTCAKASGNKVLTVEDHYPEGGLGEAVSAALSEEGVKVRRLAVQNIPYSGPPTVLLERFGISASCIVKAVKGF